MLLALELRHQSRLRVSLQPTAQSLLLDEGGETLIEGCIPWQIHEPVGKLVKQQCHQGMIGTVQHRAGERVVEPAECGIGIHTTTVDIELLALQRDGEFARAPFGEVAAVGHATGNGIAPSLRASRELRRGEHIPHHEGAVQLYIT